MKHFKTDKLTNAICISVFLLGHTIHGHAQQDAVSMHYLTNFFLINPAYAGMSKDANVSVGYRLQWAGIEGAPQVGAAAGHVSLNQNKVGAGVSIVQEKLGPNKITEANAAYAYHIKVGESTELSGGVQGGFINYQNDYSDLTINRNDPKFSTASEMVPTIGAGFLVRADKFLVSIAMPNMLPASSSTAQKSGGLYAQNLKAFASYIVQVSTRIQLRPSVLVRATQNLPLSVDYVATVKIDDSYSIGVFTRNFNTAGAVAMVNVGNTFRIGYVFEAPLSSTSALNFTTHELMCGIRLKAFWFHRVGDSRTF